MSEPKSGEVSIGSKPLWMLYVESVKKEVSRGIELRARGCFTLADAVKGSGISASVLRRRFAQDKLKTEIANDPLTTRSTMFYFPPEKPVRSKEKP